MSSTGGYSDDLLRQHQRAVDYVEKNWENWQRAAKNLPPLARVKPTIRKDAKPLIPRPSSGSSQSIPPLRR